MLASNRGPKEPRLEDDSRVGRHMRVTDVNLIPLSITSKAISYATTDVAATVAGAGFEPATSGK